MAKKQTAVPVVEIEETEEGGNILSVGTKFSKVEFANKVRAFVQTYQLAVNKSLPWFVITDGDTDSDGDVLGFGQEIERVDANAADIAAGLGTFVYVVDKSGTVVSVHEFEAEEEEAEEEEEETEEDDLDVEEEDDDLDVEDADEDEVAEIEFPTRAKKEAKEKAKKVEIKLAPGIYTNPDTGKDYVIKEDGSKLVGSAAQAYLRRRELEVNAKAAGIDLASIVRGGGVNKSRVCLCGCGGVTGGNFVPGHDAKLHSRLRKVNKGEAKKSEISKDAWEYIKARGWT